MGEAKRRRAAIGRQVLYTDIATGERRTARAAGDPMKLQAQMRHMVMDRIAGGRPVADVPCAGCRQCCYHAGVDVHPELERPEDLAHLDLVEHEDGTLWLRKGEDGACVHLGPNGCKVYEHRPDACRSYDCRLYALMTVLDRFDGDRVQPTWMFQPCSTEGRAFVAACGFMGQMTFHQLRVAGEDCSAHDVAKAVITDPTFERVADAFLTLAKMAPDKLVEVLGFDPRKITPEQLSATHRRMMGSEDKP